MLRKYSDPEYYYREVKRLNVIVREACNRRILGHQYREVLARLSKQFLLAKKSAQELYLRPTLKNEGKGWTEFYKYVKRLKGNREDTVAMKDANGRLDTDSIEKANALISCYSSVFNCESSISQIQCVNSYEPVAISTKSLREGQQR
jgi:uncharacterized protein Veg